MDPEPQTSAPAAPPDGARLVGRRLGPYEVLDEVGRGGMSVVYRGRDTRLDREVAIKVLHPFLADRDDARRRFEREARAVARLQHPNILEIYDFSADGAEQSYIVTELVRGLTLRAFVERQALDPPELAAVIGVKLCGALQRAHAAGVVHRDVKPENVMIGEDGALKLMDFGIAHMRDSASLTATGTLLGSPAHMAPEAIEGGSVDERADQFSVGTILYWMATGKLPFTGKNPHALLKRIVEGKYTPPQQVNPKISDRLAEVIGRALASDPASRFADVAVLRDALLEVLREGGIADVDDTLARFCADPAPTAAVLTATVVAAFAQRAREAQARGETAQALAAHNRVLALEPGNVRARQELDALMRRLQRAALVQRARRAIALIAAGLVVAGLAGWSAWHLGLFGRAVDPLPAATPAATPDPAPAVAPPPDLPAAAPATAAPTPRAGDGVAAPPSTGTPQRPLGHMRHLPSKVVTPRPSRELRPEPAPATVPDPAVAPREVAVHVHPWADIYLDDATTPVVRGAKVATLNLAPGPHRLRFENTFTAPEELQIEVPPSGPVAVPRVQMQRMRPAYLVVVAPAEAEVKVDGKYWGTAGATRSTPIIVPLPDGQPRIEHPVEVRLPGHLPHVVSTTFTAGETRQLEVTLQPEPAVAPAANSP